MTMHSSGHKISGPVALADDRDRHLQGVSSTMRRRRSRSPRCTMRWSRPCARMRGTAAAKAAADRAVKQLQDGADFDAVAKSTGRQAGTGGLRRPQRPAAAGTGARCRLHCASRRAHKPEYRSLTLDNGGAAVLRRAVRFEPAVPGRISRTISSLRGRVSRTAIGTATCRRTCWSSQQRAQHQAQSEHLPVAGAMRWLARPWFFDCSPSRRPRRSSCPRC